MKIVKRLVEKYPKMEGVFVVMRRILFFCLAWLLGLLTGWYSRGSTENSSAFVISAGAETDVKYEDLAPVYVGQDLSSANWIMRPSEIAWKITSSNGDYIYNSNGGGAWNVTAVSSMYGSISVQPAVWQKFGQSVWPSDFIVSAIEVQGTDGTYTPTFNTFWFYEPGGVDQNSYDAGIDDVLQFERENNVYLRPVTVGMDLYGKNVVCVSTLKEWTVYFGDNTTETARNCAVYHPLAGGRIADDTGRAIILVPMTLTYVMYEGAPVTMTVTSMSGDVSLYVAYAPDDGELGSYDEGYEEGYGAGRQDGYEEGYEDRKSEEGGIRTEWYQLGYDDGYREGKSVGEQLSYATGYREGYDVGNDEGYRTGYVAGTSALANDTTTFFGQLFAVFDVELFGNVTIGHIVFIPIILGLLAIVFKIFGR